MSDYKVETSFASVMETSPDFHLHPHNSNHLEPKSIPLYDDSNSERVSGNSLKEEISSYGSLDALIQTLVEELITLKLLYPLTF